MTLQLLIWGLAVAGMLGLTLWRPRTRLLGLVLAIQWLACTWLSFNEGWAWYSAVDTVTGLVVLGSFARRHSWEAQSLIVLIGAMLFSHVVFWSAYDAGIYVGEAYQIALDSLFSVALFVVSLDGAKRVWNLSRAWLSARLFRPRPDRGVLARSGEKEAP